ncbi:MAG: carbamoyltransferase C-terminal domain-containing protein [Bacteroides sp.]
MARATLAIYGIKDRNSLEFPAYIHDHNLCLMQDGQVRQYLQLERYTRRKYDNRLDLFLEELVGLGLLALPEEFDLVSVNAFVGNAFISQSGKLRFEAPILSALGEALEPAQAYYQYSDWEGRALCAYNCSHELAHIASNIAFYGSFRENSLLIHFDGAASLSNFSAFHFHQGKLQLLEYGWEMKYLANFFNDNALSFALLGAKPGEHTSVPGKLMGYASWGRYDEGIAHWLFAHNYFKEYWHKEAEIVASARKELGIEVDCFDNQHDFWQHVAATLQDIFTQKLIAHISALQHQTRAQYLYYSGGCALNIVANTALIESGLFQEVFIPPCCNDSGLSLGAACLLELRKGNTIRPHTAYLNNLGIEDNAVPISDATIEAIAQLLLRGSILGVCNGTAEAGPRALGNRSLIALADDVVLARHLSQDIKKREWYRPIAPIMLTTVADKITTSPVNHLAKYMLLDYKIKPEYAGGLTGVIHANGTTRIQTLDSEHDNPFMFRLLSYLYARHQILGLINTSFNVQGQPIVHTAADAIETSLKMGLDGLVLNHQLITKDALATYKILTR